MERDGPNVGETWWLPDGPFLRRYRVTDVRGEHVRLESETVSIAKMSAFKNPKAFRGEEPPYNSGGDVD